jgi:hypothetical protein
MDSKKTICGYAWTDVYSTLGRSIGNSDMKRAQRWAAELLCSETGVSRLEAILFAIWAEHVGAAMAQWPALWHTSISVLRTEWMRAGGDNKAFRNMPAIRNRIAECVGYLVVAAKRPRPSMPKSTDVFKEAEAVKTRLHGGGASPDQISTQRVWDTREDAPTMRTLGNEIEASIRTAQTPRALFWLVWILTLDGQKTRPAIKERAPLHIQGKARKSLAWFIVAILKDMAQNGLDSQMCIKQIIECLELVWIRLGPRYRREVIGTIVVMLCERVKSAPFEARKPHECVDTRSVRASIEDIDSVYEEVARDMKIVPQAAPEKKAVNETAVPSLKNEIKANKDVSTRESNEKMDKTYKLMRKMYGMDEED